MIDAYVTKVARACELSEPSRSAALYLLAAEIRGCAWQFWARAEAEQLAARAHDAIDPEVDLLDGLDTLVSRGDVGSRSQ
jgi:hypothetical protein